MNIQINDQRTIKEIQDEFSTQYPWLKLEFFSKPHAIGEASHKKQLIPGTSTINQARTQHTKGTINIASDMTVSSLEQEFHAIYGLSVQVFRHTGDNWLETTTTDAWTLEKQNEYGKTMSEAR